MNGVKPEITADNWQASEAPEARVLARDGSGNQGL
jgi:hypothetical protein